MKHNLRLACGISIALAAQTMVAIAEDVRFKGPIVDIFGERIVVQANTIKYLVNLGPRGDEVATLKIGDTVELIGEKKRSGEVRARSVVVGDGRTITIAKDRKTWRQWFLGEDKSPTKPFTVVDARTLAISKGYVVSDDPVANKKHFISRATKDGVTYDLVLHRDGRIDTQKAFLMADAKTQIAAKGYDVIGEPTLVKKHFEALALRGSEYFEVHAHRDGRIVEARKIVKTDPRWGAQLP